MTEKQLHELARTTPFSLRDIETAYDLVGDRIEQVIAGSLRKNLSLASVANQVGD